MHLSRIDLNLLVVFDTVFTAGSITAACRQLNLSQPAVSHALSRLRDVFGEPLFERQGRGIVPTPLARSIAGPVREALGAMERTFEQAARFEPSSTERHFRIGLREALEPSVLPELSQAICAAGPHLSLASARHDRPRLEADLAAGEFDVAFDVLLPVADRVPHERVLTDRLVVIARKDHPRLRRMKRAAGRSMLTSRSSTCRSRRAAAAPRWKTLRCSRSAGRVTSACAARATQRRVAPSPARTWS